EFTSPRVRSSRSFTWRRMSVGTPADIGRRTSEIGSAWPRQEAVRITLLRRAGTVINPRRCAPTGVRHVVWGLIPPKPQPSDPKPQTGSSRTLDLREDPRHDRVARHLFGFRLVRREHAVPQHVWA